LENLRGGTTEILISQAQRQMPRLIQRARLGEIIVLTQGRRRIPVARIEIIEPRIATHDPSTEKAAATESGNIPDTLEI